MKLIILVAHQRSGTNALRSALMQSRHIEDFGEAFNPQGVKYAPNIYHFMRLDDNIKYWLPERSEERFLSYYKYLGNLADKNIGILDAKYDMLRAFDPEVSELHSSPLLFRLMDKVGGGIIHLTRNPFHIYVSHRMCVETSIFHLQDSDASTASKTLQEHKLTIDLADMIDYISKRNLEKMDIDRLINYTSHRTTIRYDQLFSPDGELDCSPIWDFLNLTPQKFTPHLTKSVQKPYRDVIRNYDEVVTALEDAGWGDLA